MTPLTKKEKIYTLALSLPVFLKRNDKDGFDRAIRHIISMVDRADIEELKELAERAKVKSTGMSNEEFMDKSKELVGDIIGTIPEDMDIESPLHMMDHKDRVYHIAVGIGKAVKENNAEQAANGSAILGFTITEQDIKESQDTMQAAFKKCGCKCCLAQLELVSEIKKMDAEDNDQQPEDPWKAFGA